MEKKLKIVKSRNWEVIIYFENFSLELETVLERNCEKWFISPVHDRDLDSQGKVKKAHFHVLCFFDCVTTATSVADLFINFKVSTANVQRVGSRIHALEYLIHKNAPDKAQYLAADVRSNCDYLEEMAKTSDNDTDAIIIDIVSFIKKNHCNDFSKLVMNCPFSDWLPVLANKAYFFNLLCKGYACSQRFDRGDTLARDILKSERKKFIDSNVDTGFTFDIF
jgi:hypothetical protein